MDLRWTAVISGESSSSSIEREEEQRGKRQGARAEKRKTSNIQVLNDPERVEFLDPGQRPGYENGKAIYDAA